MSNRRTSALWTAQSPALTPNPPASGRTDDTPEVLRLKRILAGERKRHAVVLTALARYQGVLEAQITEQREAFETLGKALVPASAGRKQ
jgi:hypothetical protein